MKSLRSTSDGHVRSRGSTSDVLAQLRRWWTETHPVPGEFLPTEHDLAARMQVARSTLRLALKQLEDEGLFETVHGKGRVVKATQEDSLAARSAWVLCHFQLPMSGLSERSKGLSEFILVGVMDALQSAGLHATVLHPEHLTSQQVRRCGLERPRGLIVFPSALRWEQGRELVNTLSEAKVPLVTFERGPGMDCFDAVQPDHEMGCYELTRWLIARGRRRILRFWQWPPEDGEVRPIWLAGRDAGYERAMREAGLDVLPAVETRLLPPEAETAEDFGAKVRQAAGYLPEHLSGANPVDAILAGSDNTAFAIAAACRLYHKEPNRDVLIAGYDNVWADCHERQWETVAPLVTVEKFNLQLGSELVRLLQARVDGQLPAQPQTVKIQPKLIETTTHTTD